MVAIQWIVGAIVILGILVMSSWSHHSRFEGNARYREAVRSCSLEDATQYPTWAVLVIRRYSHADTVCLTIESALDMADCPHMINVYVADDADRGVDSKQDFLRGMAPKRYGTHQEGRVHSVPIRGLSSLSNEAIRALLLSAAVASKTPTHVMTIREGATLVQGWDTEARVLMLSARQQPVIITSPVSSDRSTPEILAYSQTRGKTDVNIPALVKIPFRQRKSLIPLMPSVAWTGDWSLIPMQALRAVPFDRTQARLFVGSDSLRSARWFNAGWTFATPYEALVVSTGLERLAPEEEESISREPFSSAAHSQAREALFGKYQALFRSLGISRYGPIPSLAQRGAVSESDACGKHGSIRKSASEGVV